MSTTTWINASIRISKNDLINIFTQPSREMKRRELLDALKIDLDEDEDLREGICVDYLLDSIIFACNQGFQWNKALLSTHFCLELLDDTAKKGVVLVTRLHALPMGSFHKFH